MLHGKKVLVTGSSRGIGAAIATLAKGYGAEVWLHGRTQSDELLRLAEKLELPHVFFDVSKDEEVWPAVSKVGAIDVLINNAGINPSKTFFQLSNAEWQHAFAVNVLGVVNVTRSVLRGMLERGEGGSIVNIASIKGLPGFPGKPAYASSKAALIRLTKSLAEEFAPHGIRVNAVAPGFTATEMTVATLNQPQIQKQVRRVALGRIATTEEIAEAVLFLASDKASYITGECLVVDGGLSIVS